MTFQQALLRTEVILNEMECEREIIPLISV